MSAPDKPQRRRRGHGEGTISQRADGRWVARVDLGYVEGKRKRKHLYGKTRKEVAERLKTVLHQQQQGVNVAPERMTVAVFLERWLVDVAEPTTRPGTLRSYEQIVRNQLVPHVGRVLLVKLTAQHVQAMLNWLGKQGLAPRTVKRTRDVLRNALNKAIEWHLVTYNAAALADPPKVEQYEPQVLTPEQAQRLLTTAEGTRLDALVRVALALGLREGEALGLRWEDIDLEQSTLRVRHALQLVNGKLVLVKPKTAQSQRSLHLPAILVAALRQQRARQYEAQLVAGPRWQEHSFVFPTSIGTPWSARNMYRDFQKLLDRAGLPRMRFHDLRHSCATLLIAQKVDPRTVMEILGHASITTTMSIYGHVLDESKREAANVMDRLFGAVNE